MLIMKITLELQQFQTPIKTFNNYTFKIIR